MTMDWSNVLMTLTSAGLFGLIGFVWRFSHKITQMQQSLTDIERRVRGVEMEIDKTSDRMYSMVKNKTDTYK
tara:strand:+ start:365 stop:580 length:216 start_codon:yes stop_codon:yes gene_type:complete